jgi:hypothetical protein
MLKYRNPILLITNYPNHLIHKEDNQQEDLVQAISPINKQDFHKLKELALSIRPP